MTRSAATLLLTCLFVMLSATQAFSQTTQVKLKLADGSYLVVDDAWETPHGVWYRQGGLSHLLAKDKVKKIERESTAPAPTPAVQSTNDDDHFEVSEVVAETPKTNGVYDK